MIDPMPLELQDVIATHDAYRHWTPLTGSLGDGFLYCGNSVFRAVRDKAIALGIGFTTKDFCFYRVAPLAALGEILRAKKVPYHDNIEVLRHVKRRQPRIRLANTLSVKRNVVMHETAHCIADQELPPALFRDLWRHRGDRGVKERSHLHKDRALALRSALGESLANTTELLGIVAADSAIHRFFYGENSYNAVDPREQEALGRSIELIGLRGTARLVFLSFLMANTLSKSLSKSTCRRLLTLADAPIPKKKTDRKRLFDMCRFGLGLDLGFRLRTSSAYLRYELGIERDMFELNDYDALAVLEHVDSLRKRVFDLCDMLVRFGR